ncbi:hypothetical protein LINPERHAP1_LOCUS21144 [Linum perenne]
MLVDEQTIVDVEDNVDPCGRVGILGYRSPTTPTLAVTAKSWASPELFDSQSLVTASTSHIRRRGMHHIVGCKERVRIAEDVTVVMVKMIVGL